MKLSKLSPPDPRPSKAHPVHRSFRKDLEKENPGYGWVPVAVLGLAGLTLLWDVEKDVKKCEERHEREEREKKQQQQQQDRGDRQDRGGRRKSRKDDDRSDRDNVSSSRRRRDESCGSCCSSEGGRRRRVEYDVGGGFRRFSDDWDWRFGRESDPVWDRLDRFDRYEEPSRRSRSRY